MRPQEILLVLAAVAALMMAISANHCITSNRVSDEQAEEMKNRA